MNNILREMHTPPSPAGQLFWLPHAGAGAASLVRPLRGLASDYSVSVANLPGREDRFREGLLTPLPEVVMQFADEIERRINGPFAIIGHSFGSLVGYLICQELITRGLTPRALTVMTLGAPNRINRIPSVSDKSDAEFVNFLDERFGGVPEALRVNQDALDLFIPIVKYDMQMLEDYEHQPLTPLPLPIIALGGTEDSAVSRSDLAQWEDFTSASFSMRVVPGDHFFPLQQMQQVINMTSKHF